MKKKIGSWPYACMVILYGWNLNIIGLETTLQNNDSINLLFYDHKGWALSYMNNTYCWVRYPFDN